MHHRGNLVADGQAEFGLGLPDRQMVGLQPDLAEAFIATHAPQPLQEGYAALWQDFMEESQRTLQSDMDYALNDALALLRRECNVG